MHRVISLHRLTSRTTRMNVSNTARLVRPSAHTTSTSLASAIGSSRLSRTFQSSSIALNNHHNNNNNNNNNNNPNKIGLFSLPNLHQPADFLSLATNAISTCNDLRQQIRQSLETKQLTPRETLFLLDDISNTVCSVIDASELCRSVHTSPKWRDAASNAFQILSEYIAELNADEALYESLIPITSNSTIMNEELDEEERRMALMLQKEFERDGIHLSKEDRDEVMKLSGFVTQLETLFSNNLLNNETFQLDGDLANDVTQIIPRSVLMNYTSSDHNSSSSSSTQGYSSAFRDDSLNHGGPLNLTTEPHIINTILRHSSSSSLRKKVYMEANTACPQNLEVLDALIQQRHLLATKMGYPSYSHYFTSDKMAGNPTQVINFLQSISKACQNRYKHEMELLLNAKKHIEGLSSDTSKIEPWDMNYYNGLIKSHMLYDDEDGEDGNGNASLVGYFTVEQSLEGMKILVQRLFGIVMKEVDTCPEEQWDCLTENNVDHYQGATSSTTTKKESLIRKFEFFKEADSSPLGTLYLDLHPREGKYAHAAHFTVRCGCEIRNNDSSSTAGSQYQLPIVALVCNLSPPQSFQGTLATVLSHSEVETLYHEFGHALHSLLSRTKFQHLSGTRAAMDFVETPSHLMEYYCWNEDFLNIIGKHYITGEPIPSKSLENLVKSRNLFKAIDIQTQVVYGLFDQTIFGRPDAWKGSDLTSSTTALFSNMHKEHNVPFVEGTHWHSRFGHLVTYGAGYYSYLYASIFSADLWNSCFASGGKAFSPEAGKAYWNNILIHGGAKDPNLMLKAMLGREPSAESFFKFS